MIAANELRIGNYVLDNGITRKITGIKLDNLGDCVRLDDAVTNRLTKNIEPIPITPEILEKFGFVKECWDNGEVSGFRLTKNMDNWEIRYEFYSTGYINFDIVSDGGYDDHGSFNIIERCKYVHSLQNLYFALTSEYLEFTEPVNQ